MDNNTYEVFKVRYCAALTIAGIFLFGGLMVAYPFVALTIGVISMVAGGTYIIRRKGWLSTHNGDGE